METSQCTPLIGELTDKHMFVLCAVYFVSLGLLKKN
jgi:hypothetical protein